MFECVISRLDLCRSARLLRPLRLLPPPSLSNIQEMENQTFELQKLVREAQKARRAEETSKVEAEPTSEPGAGPREVSSSLFVLFKRTSLSRHVLGSE